MNPISIAKTDINMSVSEDESFTDFRSSLDVFSSPLLVFLYVNNTDSQNQY